MDSDLLSRGRRNPKAAQARRCERPAQRRAAWRKGLGVLTLLLSLGISGCDTAPRQDLAALPAQPAGKARFYFFREMSPEMQRERTAVLLNDVVAGTVAAGSVIYRDVAPGLYEVGVRSDRLSPHQFKMVAVEAGTSTYVRIEPQPVLGQSGAASWGNIFVVIIADPVIARRQIEGLRLSDG